MLSHRAQSPVSSRQLRERIVDPSTDILFKHELDQAVPAVAKEWNILPDANSNPIPVNKQHTGKVVKLPQLKPDAPLSVSVLRPGCRTEPA